ncbi:hypothetical protein KQX54_019883 [Cotesia glomerata]|uniref:Uncharacterized protein n=1 Tax=Cotesia glomerata TaxID=32391 RepID=A0AAV7J0V1_COTGL|nr:hypothetical protein KQX54_019883 [Cotesia glomerata]
MEQQSQEIVASGSMAEVPNDPGKMFIGGLSWQTSPDRGHNREKRNKEWDWDWEHSIRHLQENEQWNRMHQTDTVTHLCASLYSCSLFFPSPSLSFHIPVRVYPSLTFSDFIVHRVSDAIAPDSTTSSDPLTRLSLLFLNVIAPSRF